MAHLKTLRRMLGIIGAIAIVFGVVMGIINSGNEHSVMYFVVALIGTFILMIWMLMVFYERRNRGW